MVEKELELITWSNIALGHRYLDNLDQTDPGRHRRRDYEVVPAFGPMSSSYLFTEKTTLEDIVGPYGDVPKVIRTVKSLGCLFELDLVQELFMSSSTTFADILEKYPKVAKEIKSQYNKNWMEEANKRIKLSSEEYKAKVQKQYDELITVYTELDYKKDLENLKALDSLLYCEAEGFMLKLEERISKRANSKNFRLYKTLTKLRGGTPITCSKG